jgi:hypothetical protein
MRLFPDAAERLGMAAKKSERPTVGDLLANRRHKMVPLLTSEQADQVAEALSFNDEAVCYKDRLSLQVMHNLLTQHYGWRYSRESLEKAVCAHFKRASWANK